MRFIFKHLSKMSRAIVMLSLSFALVLSSSLTFAWLAANERTKSQQEMGLEGEKYWAYYYGYVFDVKENAVQTTHTDDSLLEIVFQPYDLVFKSRNKYTPVVVRIAVVNLPEDVLPDGGVATLTIKRDTTVSHNANTIDKYFSSIMRFSTRQDKTWAQDSSATYSEDGDQIYSNVDSVCYSIYSNKTGNDDSSKTFSIATLDASGHALASMTRADMISISTTFSDEDIIEKIIDGITYKAVNIYLYLTYDKDLIGAYDKTTGLGNVGLDAVEEFDNDLSSISITVTSSGD